MRWLHYAIVAVSGIVAGAASAIALAFAGLLALRLLYADPDAGGWILVFTWPIWVGLLLGAAGLGGIISAMAVHAKLLQGDTSAEPR